MDIFGIGNAIHGAVMIYFRSARQSGRTTLLLETVEDGDCVIFSNSKEADRFKHLCVRRKINITCIVGNPNSLQWVFDHPLSKGRTFFDHTWIEEYYLHIIKEAQKEIDYIQRKLSRTQDLDIENKFGTEQSVRWNS